MKWNDPRLRWEPSAHGGLQMIIANTVASHRRIWHPLIACTDLTAMQLLPDLDKPYAQVYPNGDVVWSRMGNLHLFHEFELYKYPYDTH